MEKDKEHIELRSEKIRNVMGEMPRSLIWWGNAILVIVFLLLIGLGWWIGGEFMKIP